MKILLSTSNKGKINELSKILGGKYDLVLKSDLDLEDIEVVEDEDTLEGKCFEKSKSII